MANSRVSKELTAERFVRLLNWLDPDTDRAAQRYENVRFRLIAFFSSRNVHTPEDLADQVLDRVASKIDVEEVGNKLAYVYGFAKKILLEYLTENRSNVDLEIATLASPIEDVDRSEAHAHLKKCLAELETNERELILEYMTGRGGEAVARRKNLIAAVGSSKHAVRMRIVRIKQQLRMCVEKCMA